MKSLFTIIFAFSAVLVHGQDISYNMASKMDGQITLEDSTTTRFWGYGFYLQDPQQTNVALPSPTMFGNTGDSVHINFFNASPESHTIHLHGLDVDQANDGVPSTSFYVAPNNQTTYSFEAPHPGMYLYHCHVTTTWHLAMGMYGAIIIKDPNNPKKIFADGPSFQEEYDFLTSEFDLSWNEDPLSAYPFNTFDADYFMINGKSGNQLFESTRNVVEALEGDSVLLRIGNMGYSKAQWIFPTALNATVYMSDGRPIPSAWRTDTLDVYPGERYEVLIVPSGSIYDWITIENHYLYDNQVIGSNLIGVNALTLPNRISSTAPGDIAVYPNPSNGRVTIQSSVSDDVRVINMNGKVVDRFRVVPGENSANLNELPSGMYLLIGSSIKEKLFIK